jgi:hypothetical protein
MLSLDMKGRKGFKGFSRLLKLQQKAAGPKWFGSTFDRFTSHR